MCIHTTDMEMAIALWLGGTDQRMSALLGACAKNKKNSPKEKMMQNVAKDDDAMKAVIMKVAPPNIPVAPKSIPLRSELPITSSTWPPRNVPRMPVSTVITLNEISVVSEETLNTFLLA